MRILLICGDHPRHRFMLEPVKKKFNQITCIMMKRESLKNGLPTIVNNPEEKKLLFKHFNLRYLKEKKVFGTSTVENIFLSKNLIKINKNQLNSPIVLEILKKKFDACFVMGAGLFSKKTIKKLPKLTINIHLGLSPWYRGSATLFWPSYNLEPWKTGVTFHRIDNNIDSGPILHQSVPKLKKNIGVIDLSILAIIKAQKDFSKILNALKKNKKFIYKKQKHTGKTYFSTSFRACHLKVIYELFNDKVVNYFLNNKKKNKINLIRYV